MIAKDEVVGLVARRDLQGVAGLEAVGQLIAAGDGGLECLRGDEGVLWTQFDFAQNFEAMEGFVSCLDFDQRFQGIEDGFIRCSEGL